MKLPSSKHCAAEGDGKKMDQPPPFRNPFVHALKFTPLEKAKFNSLPWVSTCIVGFKAPFTAGTNICKRRD
ncbi:hypothetical protein CHARACLAT_027165 [Characodon lateralis]|uniref:Uncharacterized protein n=1 Tax=Characodon lateralis TaxID=208331 RepID=A0ABU7DM52_9TELE|nr:hypothetical protein [Characodon lateralis]